MIEYLTEEETKKAIETGQSLFDATRQLAKVLENTKELLDATLDGLGIE